MKILSTLTLRQWLTLPFVALVLGVAILIAALSYRTGSQAVDTVSKHLLLETVARIGQAVDRHVVGSAAVLEAAFPNGMPVADRIDAELAALRTRFWIATSLHIDPNNYVYYGNQAGQFFGLWRYSLEDAELRLKLGETEFREIAKFSGISGALAPAVREQKLYEPRKRPWYKAGENSAAHTWTSIYIDFRSAELVATRARRVLNAKGELTGVVATDLSLQRLNDFVSSLQISPNALAFIIEPDGQLIASSRSLNTRRLEDGSNARISAADSEDSLQRAAYAQVQALLSKGQLLDQALSMRFVGPQDEAVELAVSQVKDDAGLDWIIAVAVPRRDFMQGVTVNVQRTVLIGGLGALLALVLGLMILGWVSRDIRRLTQAAKAVGEGRLEAPLDIQRNDEIGVLANTFRHMQHRLRTDMLTGLDNRDVMERSIDGRIELARRSADTRPFAILFADLNNFKQVNDRFGHDAGDRVLIEVGRRLCAVTRASDRVARYAGDEFVLMINDIHSREEAEQVQLSVESVLREPMERVVPGLPADLMGGGAVGLAYFPEDGDCAESLIKHADEQMYLRKRAYRLHRLDELGGKARSEGEPDRADRT